MSVARPDFTSEQLAKILLLDLQYGNPTHELLQLTMNAQMAQMASFGGPGEELTQMLNRLMSAFYTWSTNLVARRLLADQRFMPLMSSNDLVNGMNELHSSLAEDNPDLSAHLQSLATQQALSQLVGQLAEQFGANTPNSGEYDKTWKRVDQIVAVAAEQGVTPEALLETQEGRDALMRAHTTPDEFVSEVKQHLGAIPDPASIQAQMRQAQAAMPSEMLQALGLDADNLSEMLSGIGSSFGALRTAVRDWATETVYRVWNVVPDL
jgi:hypothetical protein